MPSQPVNISMAVLLIFFIAKINALQAQMLTIRDQVSHNPIVNVSVSWQSVKKIEVTDQNGQVNLAGTKENEILLFSHPAFETVSVNYNEIHKRSSFFLSEKVVQVDEVVVSANKWAQDKSRVPESIVGVSARDVIFNNPQNAADMLGQTGKVFIQKSQMGGGSPMIRGFAASSVLIVLDGIRINNAIYRSGNIQNVITIDPFLLEETEVIFGPASTLYGSDALGGVMHFKTLKPRFSSEKKMEVHGSLMSRFSTANKGKTAGASFRMYNQKLSNVFGISLSDFDDLRSGSKRTDKFPNYGKRLRFIRRQDGIDRYVDNPDSNIQRDSGYGQLNMMNKLSYRIAQRSELSHLIYFTTSTDIPRYDRLIREGDNNELDFSDWRYGPQYLMLNALSYTSYRKSTIFDQAKFTASAQIVRESRHVREYQSNILENNREKVNVYALNVDFEKDLIRDGQLFYGTEFFVNGVDSKADAKNIVTDEILDHDTRYPENGSRYWSGAAYGSITQPLNEILTLNMGARITMVQLEQMARNVDFENISFASFKQRNQAISGKIGAVVRPSDKVNINFLVSSGFRAPNVDDMGKVDIQNDEIVIPNEKLRSELTLNYETGLEFRPADRWKFEGNVFITNRFNAAVRRSITFRGESTITFEGEEWPIAGLVNANSAYIWGYSIGISGALTNYLGFQAFVNNAMGEDSDNLPLRHTPPIFGKLALTYKNKRLRAEVYSDFQGSKGLMQMAPSELSKLYLYTDDGALGWMTLNAKAAYHFNPQISVTAGIENILDSHYRPYSSGISAPGVNGIFSARYQF